MGLYKYGSQVRGTTICLSLCLYQSACVYLLVGVCVCLHVTCIPVCMQPMCLGAHQWLPVQCAGE